MLPYVRRTSLADRYLTIGTEGKHAKEEFDQLPSRQVLSADRWSHQEEVRRGCVTLDGQQRIYDVMTFTNRPMWQTRRASNTSH